MANFIRKAIVVFLSMIIGSNGFSQTDRDYIISKLRLFYIPNPNSTTTIIPIPVSRVLDTSVANIFGTNSNNNMDQFAEFLKQLFRPVGKAGGQPFLQKYTANILRLNNKIVNMQIYNDFSIAMNATATANFNPCLGSSNEVWPCAWNLINNTDAASIRERDTVSGYISMGEQYFRNDGITIGRRTFLHELTHTQDRSDRREHIWSVLNGASFSYGADQVHYFVELTPNLSATYQEGIANSFTYIYSTAEENSVKSWFAENGECIVDTRVPAGTVANASDYLYAAIKKTNPPGPGRTGQSPRYNANIVTNYKIYRLAELQSPFIIHNEQIIAIIASKYAAKCGFDKYIAALRKTNAEVTWVSTSAVAQLIKNMCLQSLPAGLSLSDVAASSRAEMPYLFAMGLVDYFTYYRSQSVADFNAIFENLLPPTLVDLYWTVGKDLVRDAAKFTMSGGKPSGIQKVEDHLTAIAKALGVK